MADLSDSLGRPKIEFLIGSVIVQDLLRFQTPTRAFGRCRTLIELARAAGSPSVSTILERSDFDREGLLALLAKFEADRQGWLERRAAGSIVLSHQSFFTGIASGVLALCAREINFRFRALKPLAAAVPWRKYFAGPKQPLTSKAKKAGRKRAAAKWTPEQNKTWLVGWIESFGFKNSGVSVEKDTARVAEVLADETIGRMRQSAVADNDLAAISAMVSAPEFKKLGFRMRLRFRRLRAVLRYTSKDLPLPERSAPAYEPIQDRIFYLLHMRGPLEANGYVSRTDLILKSMVRAGLQPEPITRLGFPNDLARHRNRDVKEFEPFGDFVYRCIDDPAEGQLGRPVDDYISAYADRIVDLAKERRPAIIHAASNYLNGLAAIIAARRLGIPCVYEVRGIWEITQASADVTYAGSLRYLLQRNMENLAVRSADRVITISAPLQRFVIEHGARPDNVSVVMNGVDVDHLRPVQRDQALKRTLGIPDEAVVIGYAGSVVFYEGLDLLIDAMALLRADGLDGFHLLLIGDGKELANLKARASTAGVDDICHFIGRVPREQIEGLYSIIDIAPFPRRSLQVTELVPPLKPYEAMAAGKAVIVSSVAAIAGCVIDGETGLIVEKDNVSALAGALRRLIEDRAFGARLGSESRDWVVKARSVDAIAGELRAIVEATTRDFDSHAGVDETSNRSVA